MAKLEVRTTPPVIPVEEFILTLTRAEAETVFSLVSSVTGSNQHSRRGYSNKVYYALAPKLGTVSREDLKYDGIFFANVPGLNIYPEEKS